MRRLSSKAYADALWQTWQKTPVAERATLLKSFLTLLREQRALKSMPRILDQVQKLEDIGAGVRRVRVEAAEALDQDQLAKQLSKALGPVTVDLTVNPALIAGLKVQVGDELIDASIATQLQH